MPGAMAEARIERPRMTVSPQTLSALREAGVAAVSQSLYGLGLMNAFIPGLLPAAPVTDAFAGPAFTLRAIPVREDLRADMAAGRLPNAHRAAMRAVVAGEVVVTGIGGIGRVSLFGDLIATHLDNIGCAGIVTDGGVADLAALRRMRLPVFSAGSAPVPGTARVMIVGWREPIACQGVPVYPGDIVVGDDNGVVVVPPYLADSIAEKALGKERLEEFLLARLQAGAPLDGTYPPDEATLQAYGAAQSDGTAR